MQIDDQVIHRAGFLGVPMGIGFYAEGTCFFLSLTEEELDFHYAVTARNIVKPFDVRTNEPNANPIWMRLQRNSAAPLEIETRRSEWISHTDRFIQICVYPFDLRKWDSSGDLDLNALAIPEITMTKEVEEHFGFGIASEVFIPSVLVNRVGEKQDSPVARIGSVASMPIKPVPDGSPRRPAYLIETKSLGGIIGAPVLFHTNPYRAYRRASHQFHPVTGHRITPYYLVGMIVGLYSGQYPVDWATGADETERSVPTDAEFNAGISVAVPISDIIDVLNREELRNARAESVKMSKKISGYRG